jgi:hypothetical protein
MILKRTFYVTDKISMYWLGAKKQLCPSALNSDPESEPGNRFLGYLNVYQFGLR